jgi:Fe2+ or Zn2+ uptake regulation protein
MASARRPAGLLRQTILDVMEDGRPERAVAILHKLHREGLAVRPSLFFRDLGKLVACGKVIRINIARSYMLAPAEQRILLFCRQCGQVSTIGLDSTFEQIASLAEEHRLRAARAIVEVAGVCAACLLRVPRPAGGTAPSPAITNVPHTGHSEPCLAIGRDESQNDISSDTHEMGKHESLIAAPSRATVRPADPRPARLRPG